MKTGTVVTLKEKLFVSSCLVGVVEEITPKKFMVKINDSNQIVFFINGENEKYDIFEGDDMARTELALDIIEVKKDINELVHKRETIIREIDEELKFKNINLIELNHKLTKLGEK